MEESHNVQNKSKQVNVELIYYLDDEEEKKGYLKLKENEIIFYNDITNSFCSFLEENQKNEKDIYNERYFDKEKNNIIFESIRYFDGDGWIALKENGVIIIDEDLTLNNLKIMIYCDILSTKEMKIKKNYEKIDKTISDIYTQMNQEKNYDSALNDYLNLVVLTANPLMDGEKELRTMNDFNIITSKIYESFKEDNFLNQLKYTEFKPLTIENLKMAISDEKKIPIILHLICKSTYIIPEKEKDPPESSEDYTNLIFEDDDNYFNVEFINKKKLEDEIFNYELNPSLEENVKKIILIISTPLATDAYNIFKNFGFKNIIIQHTTLADVNFIADFNYTFYKDIITHLPQQINNIYEDALNRDIENDNNPPTFCCCFHKHKVTCDFVKNLKNELYNNNELKNIENVKELIPHFYHLYPDCFYNGSKCSDLVKGNKAKEESKGIEFPEINFCCHLRKCYEGYQYMPEIIDKNKIIVPKGKKEGSKKVTLTFYKFCCCEKNTNIHNINNVFIKDFSAENKNNEIRFRNSEITREKEEYTPNYNKMKSFIGNNKVIFTVLQYFLSEKYFSLNIYGDNIDNLKKFGEVIIEYYLERYYYFFEYNNSSSKITRIKSAINFNNNLYEDNANKNNKIEVNKLYSTKSASLSRDNNIDFVQINLNDNHIYNLKNEEKNINNKIYFIYVHDVNMIDKTKFRYNKIIWFSETKIDKSKMELNENIQFIKEPTRNSAKHYEKNKNVTPNEYIKFQHIDDVRNNWRK